MRNTLVFSPVFNSNTLQHQGLIAYYHARANICINWQIVEIPGEIINGWVRFNVAFHEDIAANFDHVGFDAGAQLKSQLWRVYSGPDSGSVSEGRWSSEIFNRATTTLTLDVHDNAIADWL